MVNMGTVSTQVSEYNKNPYGEVVSTSAHDDFAMKTPKATNREAALSALLGMGRYRRALVTIGQILMLYGQQGWRYPEKAHLHQKSAEKLAALCERNGVTWIKAAQFFSNRPDILPPEYLHAFQRLQDTVAPVPFADISKQLAKTWGTDWSSQFKHFSHKPVATASIAQVHKAQLLTGDWVAVKVLLPDVRKIFNQDRQVFEWAARIIKPLVKEIDAVQVVGQLLATTQKELDFKHEAKHHIAFYQCEHMAGIRVPRLYHDLCTSRVLVTEWVNGERLRDVLSAQPDKAKPLLQRLFVSYLQQVTEFGLFQADPHPGNFLVDHQDNIVILDFGAMGVLQAAETSAYQALFSGLIQNNLSDEELLALFQQAGFVGGKAQSLRELSGYMLTNRLAKESTWESAQNIMRQLRADKVHIPDSYVGISRVLITLGGLLQLYEVLPPWQEAQ